MRTNLKRLENVLQRIDGAIPQKKMITEMASNRDTEFSLSKTLNLYSRKLDEHYCITKNEKLSTCNYIHWSQSIKKGLDQKPLSKI